MTIKNIITLSFLKDFSDWRPSTVFDRSKKLKKDNNPEKEKEEQALSQESASPQINKVRQRTPQTFPRTRITATTPASQRAALENLRQFLTFSDAGSEVNIYMAKMVKWYPFL